MNELLLNMKCVGLLKAVNFSYVLTHNLVAFYVDLGKKINPMLTTWRDKA